MRTIFERLLSKHEKVKMCIVTTRIRLLVAAMSGSFACLITWRIHSLHARGFWPEDRPWYLLWEIVNLPVYLVLNIFELPRPTFFVALYITTFALWFLLGYLALRIFSRFVGTSRISD